MSQPDAQPLRHPAPRRDRTTLLALFFGLIAAPAAWIGQHLVAYGLASYACYPNDVQRFTPLPAWTGLRPILVLITLGFTLLALCGGWVAYRSLRATRDEGEPRGEGLLESGEGRSRFLAASGVFVTVLFLGAIFADALMILGAPLCRD